MRWIKALAQHDVLTVFFGRYEMPAASASYCQIYFVREGFMGGQGAAPAHESDKFHIRAALHEESTNGWVWCNRQPSLKARSLVTIENLRNGRSVVCEHREIDEHFVNTYNSRKACSVEPLQHGENAIVMSFWYRRALGIPTIGVEADLRLTPARKYLGELRAGAEHADPAVRLGTRVGMLSLWLGIDGIVLGTLSLVPRGALFLSAVAAIITMISTGFFLRWTVAGVPDGDEKT